MQPDSYGFVSPVDGRILRINKVSEDKQIIIKNREYSITELINSNKEILDLKKN